MCYSWITLKPPRLRQVLINVSSLGLLLQPEVRIGQGAKFIDTLPLLLDPGVVLLIVPALAVIRRTFLHPIADVDFVEDIQATMGFLLGHLADSLVEPLHHRWITVKPVGRNSDNILALV